MTTASGGRRGSALLLVLLLAALLAMTALASAFLARTQLLLARNRALALQAEAAAWSGAALGMERIAAEVRSRGALPDGLTLPRHPDYDYRLRDYRRPTPDSARFEIEGSSPGGGRALIGVVVRLAGGELGFRVLR